MAAGLIRTLPIAGDLDRPINVAACTFVYRFDLLESHAETLQVAPAILFGGRHHSRGLDLLDGVVYAWIRDFDRLIRHNFLGLRGCGSGQRVNRIELWVNRLELRRRLVHFGVNVRNLLCHIGLRHPGSARSDIHIRPKSQRVFGAAGRYECGEHERRSAPPRRAHTRYLNAHP